MAKSKDQTFGSECAVSVAGTVMFGVSEGLKEVPEWDEPQDTGMTGTDKPKNSGRQVTKKDVGGPLVIRPSYKHAQTILQTWFDETAGTFTAADDPNGKSGAIVIDREVDIYTYAACWLSQMELRFTENEPVDFALELLGTTEADSGSVGALTPPDKILASDLTVSLGGSTYFPIAGRVRFNYDYQPAGGRFHQSLTRSSVAAKTPWFIIELDFDYNPDTWGDLFDLSGTDTTIDDVLLTFTDSTYTLIFDAAETTNVTPSKWSDQDGVEEKTHTLALKAWLDAGETEVAEFRFSS